MADDLGVRLLAFIRKAAPFAYCEACLAARLGTSAESLAAALAVLVDTEGPLERTRRLCYGRGRTVALTALRSEPPTR